MHAALPRHRTFRIVAAAAAALLALSIAGCTSPPDPPEPPSPTATTTGPPPAPVDVRIAAVGDMNGPKTTKTDSPSGKNGAAITRLVQNNEIDAFLGLGDFQYDIAQCEDYVEYWTKLWGGTMSKLYWV